MPNPALNATRHGLLSELPVLDGVETREAWLAHRQKFWDDLQPHGTVEETLVERIALTFWRLARLARAEVAAANRHREKEVARAARVWSPELQGFLTLAEAREELRHRDHVCDWLAAYANHPDSDPLPPALVKALQHHLEQIVDAHIAGLTDWLPSTSRPSALESADLRAPSTARHLRALFQHVATATAQPLETVLQRVTTLARDTAYTFSRALREAERQVEQVRATCQLPPEPELQLLTRYDAHLGRELARLFRTLRDLRTLPSSSPVPTPPELGAGGLTPSPSSSNLQPAPAQQAGAEPLPSAGVQPRAPLHRHSERSPGNPVPTPRPSRRSCPCSLPEHRSPQTVTDL